MSQTLHQQLVQLRGRAKVWLETGRRQKFYPTSGICDNLELDGADKALLDALLARWPGGNGSDTFPVPHPDKGPVYAFRECDAQEMWNPKFEYARNRWALLEWLIEQTASTVQLGEKS